MRLAALPQHENTLPCKNPVPTEVEGSALSC
nr:MAG TPA: hypothetical protein [Caudoviricetes sp.]